MDFLRQPSISHKRRRIPAVEAMEPRWCPSNFFAFEVAARTGDVGLVNIKPSISINDNGYVAFVGEANNGDGQLADNIYAFNTSTGTVNPLMNSVFMYP